MKNFPLLLFFLLFSTVTFFGQIDQKSSCPSLNVRGGGLPLPGEITYFTADVDTKRKQLKLEYFWTVSGGEITEGQGRETIAVKASKEGSLIATVEVKGFPEGCPNTCSESHVICNCVHPFLLDEFSIHPSLINKKGLNELAAKLREVPSSRAYIIEYFKRGTSQAAVNRKIGRITDYLVNEKNLKKENFTVLTVLDNEYNRTNLWIVPPGAEAPIP